MNRISRKVGLRPRIAPIAGRARRLSIASAFAISMLVCTSAIANDSVYSATRGQGCYKLPESHLSGNRCRGPAGISFVILDDGNVIGVEFGPPGRETVVSGMHWRAVGHLIGDKVEWRMAHGRVYAAIVRAFTLDDDEKPVERLFVAKVSQTRSCQIASLDARQHDANQMARRIADQKAPTHQCIDPR